MTDSSNLTPVRGSYSFRSSKFWCFNCPREFSKLRTDDSEVLCPACNSVCEEIDPNNHPRNTPAFTMPQNSRNTSSSGNFGYTQQQRPTQQTTHRTQPNTQNSQNTAYSQQNPNARPQVHFQRFYTVLSPNFIIERESPTIVISNGNLGGIGGFGGLGGLDAQLLGLLGGFGGFGGFGGLFGAPDMFGQNAMNQIIEEFLRNDPNKYGPPPASQDSISKLNEYSFDPCDSTKTCKTCSICQDDYVKEDKVLQMPCKHEFHKDCVMSWLKLHNTCPVCRQSVEGQQQKQATANQMKA